MGHYERHAHVFVPSESDVAYVPESKSDDEEPSEQEEESESSESEEEESDSPDYAPPPSKGKRWRSPSPPPKSVKKAKKPTKKVGKMAPSALTKKNLADLHAQGMSADNIAYLNGLFAKHSPIDIFQEAMEKKAPKGPKKAKGAKPKKPKAVKCGPGDCPKAKSPSPKREVRQTLCNKFGRLNNEQRAAVLIAMGYKASDIQGLKKAELQKHFNQRKNSNEAMEEGLSTI